MCVCVCCTALARTSQSEQAHVLACPGWLIVMVPALLRVLCEHRTRYVIRVRGDEEGGVGAFWGVQTPRSGSAAVNANDASGSSRALWKRDSSRAVKKWVSDADDRLRTQAGKQSRPHSSSKYIPGRAKTNTRGHGGHGGRRREDETSKEGG